MTTLANRATISEFSIKIRLSEKFDVLPLRIEKLTAQTSHEKYL